jgi:hypothetical protein
MSLLIGKQSESQSGMMKSESSHAEATAALLLQGERSNLPVLIPGAFERRASASAGPHGYGTGMPGTDHTYAVAVSARERAVYEREGGGAPNERGGEREISSR